MDIEEIKRRIKVDEETAMHESQVGDEIVILEVAEPLSQGEAMTHVLKSKNRKEASTEVMEEIIPILK